jgi:Putative lactococcus lactis phage r1t holin
VTNTQLLDVGERALRTFAQSLVAFILTYGSGVGLADVDWRQGLGLAVVAAVVSLLTSVASWGVGPEGPSLVTESDPAPDVEPDFTVDLPELDPEVEP